MSLDVPEKQRCKHFDICGLDYIQQQSEGQFCMLHLRSATKDRYGFSRAIQQHLESRGPDFRYVYFHAPVSLAHKTFSAKVDFTEAVFVNAGLNLEHCIFQEGLTIRTEQISAINLASATLNGPISIEVEKPIAQLILSGATFSQEVVIKIGRAEKIDFSSAVFNGPVRLELDEVPNLIFFDVRLSQKLTVIAKTISSIEFSRTEGSEMTINGPIEITTRSNTSIRAISTKFGKDLSIKARMFGGLTMTEAELWGRLTIRGDIQASNFDKTKIKQGIDLEKCTAKSLAFRDVNFDASAELNLSNCNITGKFELVEARMPPKLVRLDGCRIEGDVSIEAELGAQAPCIVATNLPPRFGQGVSFKNVDLSECGLVGNAIDRMKFASVRWKTRFGRSVLYDEVALRKRKTIFFSFSDLKEAYQILKQKYQSNGDHARAGDFHYGEMEMKRREYGWPRRVIWPEFFYWALSGYGIAPLRAFFALFLIVIGWAAFYLCTDAIRFSFDYFEALLFSFQVATLQRPPMPKGLSEAGRWLYAIQTILGPLQAALFALALRMRLKR